VEALELVGFAGWAAVVSGFVGRVALYSKLSVLVTSVVGNPWAGVASGSRGSWCVVGNPWAGVASGSRGSWCVTQPSLGSLGASSIAVVGFGAPSVVASFAVTIVAAHSTAWCPRPFTLLFGSPPQTRWT